MQLMQQDLAKERQLRLEAEAAIQVVEKERQLRLEAETAGDDFAGAILSRQPSRDAALRAASLC